MAKIIVQLMSGGYDKDIDKAQKSDTVELNYDRENGDINISINIDGPDHFLTYQFNLTTFMQALAEAIKEG